MLKGRQEPNCLVMHHAVNINPRTPSLGTLAGDSQHYVSLLVNQVISKASEAYSPLCPGAGGAGFILTGA